MSLNKKIKVNNTGIMSKRVKVDSLCQFLNRFNI
jgi:hypothetical protein